MKTFVLRLMILAFVLSSASVAWAAKETVAVSETHSIFNLKKSKSRSNYNAKALKPRKNHKALLAKKLNKNRKKTKFNLFN